jgi:hypothetical protein
MCCVASQQNGPLDFRFGSITTDPSSLARRFRSALAPKANLNLNATGAWARANDRYGSIKSPSNLRGSSGAERRDEFWGWGWRGQGRERRAAARARHARRANNNKAAEQTNAKRPTTNKRCASVICSLRSERSDKIIVLPNNEVMQMTKAQLSNYEATLRVKMITAACTLAHQRAIAATKQALRARGLRVTEYSHREISLMAVEYAKRHGAELLNDAAETIERWRAEGFFGKRAQRCFVQPLRLANPEPIQNPLRAAS